MDKNDFERMIRENQDKLPPQYRLSEKDITNIAQIAEGIDLMLGFFFKPKKKNPLEDLVGKFGVEKLVDDVITRATRVRDVKKSVWDAVQETDKDVLDEKPCPTVESKPTVAHDEHEWWDPIERMAENLPANCWCLGVTKTQADAYARNLSRLVDLAKGASEKKLLKAIFRGVVPPQIATDQARLHVMDLEAGTDRHVAMAWARDNQFSVVTDTANWTVTCEVCWALISPTVHGMVHHRKGCEDVE